MACAGNAAQWDGWQQQAAGLALKHGAVGVAALAIAKQTRWRRLSRWATRRRAFDAESEPGSKPNNFELRNELELTGAEQRDAEPQESPEPAAAPLLNEPIQTLPAQDTAAEKRVAELEGELRSTQEELTRREHENRSLQTSIDSIVSKLSRRLAERDAAVDKACSELAQAKTALTLAEAERNKLVTAVDEANEKRQIETKALNAYIDSLTLRAIAAERLLAKAGQHLRARAKQNKLVVGENAHLSRRLAESDAAAARACCQLEQVKAALTATEAERNQLVAAIDDENKSRRAETNTLNTRLEAMTSRAIATAKQLAQMRQRLLEKLDLLQNSFEERIRQVQELEQSQSKLIEDTGSLPIALDTREWDLACAAERIKKLAEPVIEPMAEASEPIQLRPTAALLASTITF